jgi:2-C-methyl-D-erythritol 4-phosphate cytidylyltransferase
VKAQLLIAAAGSGRRLGATHPKALVQLAGKPLVIHTLARFDGAPLAEPVIVMTPPGAAPTFEHAFRAHAPRAAVRLVEGGARRQDSVMRGLAALDADTGLVVVHDAARPFVSADSIRAAMAAAETFGAATVALPCVDTILIGDANGFLEETPERARLWACQTPQVFQVALLRAAHERAHADGFTGTDDASLVRRLGEPVKLVEGTPLNLKITTAADLKLAEAICDQGLASCG